MTLPITTAMTWNVPRGHLERDLSAVDSGERDKRLDFPPIDPPAALRLGTHRIGARGIACLGNRFFNGPCCRSARRVWARSGEAEIAGVSHAAVIYAADTTNPVYANIIAAELPWQQARSRAQASAPDVARIRVSKPSPGKDRHSPAATCAIAIGVSENN